MRDILVFVVVSGTLPFILWRPPIGILVWSWLGYMNPHRLTWGIAYGFPFSQLVAVCTLIGLVFYKDKRWMPLTPVTFFLTFFVAWMTLSTIFSIYPEAAWSEWDRTIKIQLFTFLTIVLMQKEHLVKMLVWTIALSLGFFGIKGGFFSILTGGKYLVWGPEGSFIGDNNSLALALLMALPLMRFCHLQLTHRFARLAMLLAMALTAICILTSHSRGALVGATAMMLYAWWKGKGSKVLGLVAIAASIPLVIFLMPDEWFQRMGTISEFDQDASAMGRINAWWFAFNFASDRPFLGGGFQVFSPELFLRYAPRPEDFHDAHSVYFEVLAEHGFVGLALFLILGALSLRLALRLTKTNGWTPEGMWIPRLAQMIQVSLIGYAVTGAFLGLAYFDLYYQLVGILVILGVLAKRDARLLGEASLASSDVGAGGQLSVTVDDSRHSDEGTRDSRETTSRDVYDVRR